MWMLAWRNLWRNRTRTIILLTAIALPYASMIVAFGFLGDFLRKMEERSARSAGGTVLVHGEGYWSAKSNDIVLEEAGQLRDQLEGVDGVEEAIPRVLLQGMLSSPHGNVGGVVTGLDPRQQARLQDFSKYLVEGDFLSEEHERPIVLGADLAESLEVEIGDKVVLTASDLDGEMTRGLFRLRGLLETGSDQMDESLALTRLDVAQQALGLGDRVHQIGLVAEDGHASRDLAERIRGTVGDIEGMEILTWQEAMPEMVSYLAVERGGTTLMILVIFLIVSFVIANTFLMSVMERVREFGLFSALGLNHWRIGKLVLAETVMLTLLAVGIGFAIGFGGHLAIDHYGIDVVEMFGGEMQLSGVALSEMVMRSDASPVKWLIGTVCVVVLVFVAAAYPAWKAMQLAPTEAMEFYEH